MNVWVQKSIELASQSNYLDLLYKIYPMSVNLRRELSTGTQQQIQFYLKHKDGKNLLKLLSQQEIFPIKDSYVAYLKRDTTAIDRNPATAQRLSGMLIQMGFADILDKTTAPKETNRQIGSLFKNWISSGVLGVPITNNQAEFLAYSGNIVFNDNDTAMQNFATQHLGYSHQKGLDFIAKFNNTIVVAEAKFLSDFGDHQTTQFNDAISTMQSLFVKMDYLIKPIAILDDVLYSKGNHKMFNALNGFDDDKVILSATLLRDFLFSL